jgi:hypothetical protein
LKEDARVQVWVLEKPDWMLAPAAEWTDAQRKLAADFADEQARLDAERTHRRAALDAEVRDRSYGC